MKFAPSLIVCLCLATLAACSTTPAGPEPDPLANCPEPVICPVCETPEPQVCPEPEIIEKIVEVPAPLPPMAKTAGELHLPIIGIVEDTLVEPAGIVLAARIDTGADTSAIHADDIQLVEKEGKRYVRFTLPDGNGEPIAQELPLRKRETLKLADGDTQRRYVVRMWLTLGEIRSRIDVALENREQSEYKLLVGRNFLLDTAIVDVSRKHTQASPEPPSS